MNKTHHPTALSQHFGFSMISALVGIFICALVTALGTSLLAKSIQGDGLDKIDNATADLRKHLQLWQDTALGAGANLDGTPDLDTIRVCSLQVDPNTGKRSCMSSYRDLGENCFMYLSQNLRGKQPVLNIRGFRVVDGQLQYYSGGSSSLNWNGHKFQCENDTQWTPLNDLNIYSISSLRVCQVNTADSNFHNIDYANQCTTILATNPERNRAWALLVTTQQSSNASITKNTVAWLWHQNATKVSRVDN